MQGVKAKSFHLVVNLIRQVLDHIMYNLRLKKLKNVVAEEKVEKVKLDL